MNANTSSIFARTTGGTKEYEPVPRITRPYANLNEPRQRKHHARSSLSLFPNFTVRESRLPRPKAESRGREREREESRPSPWDRSATILRTDHRNTAQPSGRIKRRIPGNVISRIGGRFLLGRYLSRGGNKTRRGRINRIPLPGQRAGVSRRGGIFPREPSRRPPANQPSPRPAIARRESPAVPALVPPFRYT